MKILGFFALAPAVLALDCGPRIISTRNGWEAFEVISEKDNPEGNYSMPGTFDGSGAFYVDADTLRVLVNHETGDASISQIDLNKDSLLTAISNVIDTGSCGGASFVTGARQAYDRWSDDGGSSWTLTTTAGQTSFKRLCSSQTYAPNIFGTNQGFVDDVYIAGEEVSGGRLFALDLANRDLYQLSGVIGAAPGGGTGGMSFDAWENVALLDTQDTNHVALLLSADGGSEALKLYIGEKGKADDGSTSSSFLARNGLAYGSWYYLKGSFPGSEGGSKTGSFDTDSSGSLSSNKLEDVHTSPSEPTKVVLADQSDPSSGVFILEFDLSFVEGSFDAPSSSYSISKISDSGSGGLNAPDNVVWTDSTTLGDNSYPQGLIFVNEDNRSGEIYQMNPDGSNKVRVGKTTIDAESTGIFDLSKFVGYNPGSILITNNQGSPSSMTVLIHPDATISTGTQPPSQDPTLAPDTTPAPTQAPTTPDPTPAPTQAPTTPDPTPSPATPVPTTSAPSGSCLPEGQGFFCGSTTFCCAGVGNCKTGQWTTKTCAGGAASCLVDSDCDDGMQCTVDTCDAGQCSNVSIPSCGQQQPQCGGHGTECSVNAECCSNRCILGSCLSGRRRRRLGEPI